MNKQNESTNRDDKGRFINGDAGKDARFKKGHTPWNKGKTGYMGPNKTSFKKGNVPPQQNPEGTVTRHERKRNGRIEITHTINIDWKGNRKVSNNYKWYLWEVANQQDRPDGKVIYLKNQDPDDLRLSNFEVISRGELVRRNRGS